MNLLLISCLVMSKLFYISIFQIGDFNFTFSDVCFIVFLAQIGLKFLSAKYVRDTTIIDMYDYLRRALIFAAGAFVLNIATTVAAGAMPLASILHMFKRWLSMMIIPFYFCRCVKYKEKLVWICIGALMIYSIANYGSITQANAQRYYAEGEFNPNILGGVFGVILLYILNSKYTTPVKIGVSVISVFMIFACSTRGAVLAVGAAIIFLRFLTSDEDASAKIGKLLGTAILGIAAIYAISKVIPAATGRIFDSFRGGITNEVSYISRVKIAKQSIAACIYNPRLLLFGTGFGSRNQAYVFARYGYNIGTSDNMYIDMLCWMGIIGLPFVFLYLKDLFMMSYDIYREGFQSALAITVYMFFLGFSQSAIFEPTVGGIYYILLSFDMIRAMDIEEARRRSEIDAEEKTDA